MQNLNSFRAIYCSGLLIPDQSTVTALSLLFEKLYLPNNIELVIEFAKTHVVRTKSERYKDLSLTPQTAGDRNPLDNLTEMQKETAYKYIDWSMHRAVQNHALFGPVIESTAFGEEGPLSAKLIREGNPGELNTYHVSQTPLQLSAENTEELRFILNSGYVPVMSNSFVPKQFSSTNHKAAKQLAALLAIKSVEMLFPATRPVPDEVILEARHKLRDQLPLFWSAMFKLSINLNSAIAECKDPEEISRFGTDLVDTIVRPALTDLNHKIELERKQWFQRIFGSVFKSLKVVAANPPLTPEQLLQSSLVLGADTAMSAVDHYQKIAALRNEAGLTYLLDLNSIVNSA